MAKAADRSLVRRQLLPEGLRRARADSSPTVAGTEARRSRIEARLLVTILCGQGGASEQPERRLWRGDRTTTLGQEPRQICPLWRFVYGQQQ